MANRCVRPPVTCITITPRKRSTRSAQRSGSAAWPSSPRPNERGERVIWLEDAMADRLGAMRGQGEGYSDVILRIVGSMRERT